jgi:hypothetical protein
MQGRQGHSVQFYQDDSFLTESVTSFLKEGLQVNDTLIVVATAQHREQRLEALTPGERAHDKLMFIDAGDSYRNSWWTTGRANFGSRMLLEGMIGQARQKTPKTETVEYCSAANVIVRNEVLPAVDRTVESFPTVLNNGSLLYWQYSPRHSRVNVHLGYWR